MFLDGISRIVDRVGIRVLREPFTAKPFVLFYMARRLGADYESQGSGFDPGCRRV